MFGSVILLQTAIGDYRSAVLHSVAEKIAGSFLIACGDNYFEETVKTSFDSLPPVEIIRMRNYYIWKRKFLWQTGGFFRLLKANVVIAEMNPRILTTWLLLISRKALGKKTVLWGHAWPRSGPDANSDFIRDLMRKLADVLVVYTETQKEELITRFGSFTKIIAAPNALYKKESMYLSMGERKSFLYVGRMVKEKKPEVLLRAFQALTQAKDISEDINLVFVGEGPEKKRLMDLASEIGVAQRVQFLGHVSDICVLRALYSTSLVSVSPGYVGLSITQSLSFGVPILISKDEPHAPEVEAAKNGFNCLFFETDSVESLAETMFSVWVDRVKWLEHGQSIVDDCIERYSVEHMSSRLIEAVEYAKNRA